MNSRKPSHDSLRLFRLFRTGSAPGDSVCFPMRWSPCRGAFVCSVVFLPVLARSLRLLAALDARAFIMLTLAELGKRTRLGTRTLKAAQCAVNRLVFLDADLRHSFPSLRAFPYGGTLCTVFYTTAQKTVRILYLLLPSVSTTKFCARPRPQKTARAGAGQRIFPRRAVHTLGNGGKGI